MEALRYRNYSSILLHLQGVLWMPDISKSEQNSYFRGGIGSQVILVAPHQMQTGDSNYSGVHLHMHMQRDPLQAQHRKLLVSSCSLQSGKFPRHLRWVQYHMGQVIYKIQILVAHHKSISILKAPHQLLILLLRLSGDSLTASRAAAAGNLHHRLIATPFLSDGHHLPHFMCYSVYTQREIVSSMLQGALSESNMYV